MGCNTSNPEHQVPSSTRRQSEVLVGVHVRAEAAYRRQKMAREMEQTVAMRAHLEVEKAKIRKTSIDCGRRPSRPLTSVYEEPEPEKADENKEIEERKETLIVPSGEIKEKIEECLEDELRLVAHVENMSNSEVENGTRELVSTETQIRGDGSQLNTYDEEKPTENTNKEQRESNNDEESCAPPIHQADPLSSYQEGEGEASGTTDEETKPATEQVSEDHEEHSEATKPRDSSADSEMNGSHGAEFVRGN